MLTTRTRTSPRWSEGLFWWHLPWGRSVSDRPPWVVIHRASKMWNSVRDPFISWCCNTRMQQFLVSWKDTHRRPQLVRADLWEIADDVVAFYRTSNQGKTERCTFPFPDVSHVELAGPPWGNAADWQKGNSPSRS